MFHLVLVVVGRLKTSYVKEAVAEYQKRLKPFAKVIIEIIPDEPTRDEHDTDRVRRLEGGRLMKHLSKYSTETIFLLTEKGKQRASVEFAQWLSRLPQPLVLVIGGPAGFSKDILAAYPQHISLSPLTFTHEWAQAILLEQLYRAITIVNGKLYHVA